MLDGRRTFFDKFSACFSHLINSFYNLGRLIDEEKQIENILSSFPHHLNAKVTSSRPSTNRKS